MKNYLYYTPEELAQDDRFIEWVKAPDPESDLFWQNWLETYPFKRADVAAARQLILISSQPPEHGLTPGEAARMKKNIFRRIASSEKRTFSFRTFSRRMYYAAACVVILWAAGWYLNFHRSDRGQSAQLVSENSETTIFENSENTPKYIDLPDGSSVVLGVGSRMSMPNDYGEKTRDIYLTGEAFFEVKKKQNMPFLVHAKEIVTKVLGTSFHVKAFPYQKHTRVLVKTGKVSIYELRKSSTSADDLIARPGDLILEANQEAVYDHDLDVLQFLPHANREDEPLPSIMDISFEYDETPVGNVFADLEKAYHIEITYDQKTISNCRVTASFGDEPFYEKLRLICIAIGANYEIINDQINVTGRGCY